MYLSAFTQFRESMNMRTYPHDPHDYCENIFLPTIDKWINEHERAKYLGLDTFPIHHVILGVTHHLKRDCLMTARAMQKRQPMRWL
mgnify:CR=1 FL=1